jgi:ribosome-associated protein
MPQLTKDQGRRTKSDGRSATQTTPPPPHETAAGLDNACRCAATCESFRGKDTIVLDLTGITPLFDYFVITTATNRRQMHAIADEVNRVMKRHGSSRRGLEGYDGSSWVVEDYGDVVLHVFVPETRQMYDLENLWGDAPRVEWQDLCPDDE